MNVAPLTADAAATGLPDDCVDVVHAHQVWSGRAEPAAYLAGVSLQHVGDPVAVLAEMRRVCRPGGIVAARDADYATFTWYPESPALTAWLDLYRRVQRANGGEPDAGRRLRSWAQLAGFTDVAATSSTWTYADADAPASWARMWADRLLLSPIRDQAVGGGHATPADLDEIAAGWLDWGGAPDAWFALVHGEILCRA